jgi:hypothetical protein
LLSEVERELRERPFRRLNYAYQRLRYAALDGLRYAMPAAIGIGFALSVLGMAIALTAPEEVELCPLPGPQASVLPD